MKRITLIALVLLTGFSFAQTSKSDILKRLKGVEKELEEIRTDWQAAGFAVAVVNQDGLVWSKGVGYRDLENKTPVDPNTIFAIGSCSKAFTSALIGQLESEKMLSLKDQPAKHVPFLKFENSEMDNMITIADLMCHRTGLPRHDYAWYFFPSQSKDSLIMRVKHHEPFAKVREKWRYNNFMFLLQGVIVEKITGQTWEKNVEERLFKLLDMKRSTTNITDWMATDNISIGYELYQDSVIRKSDYYDIAGMSPAGAINSSVNEMANWVTMFINGGTYKGEEIVPANFVREAIGSQMVVGTGIPDSDTPESHFANYGYGWFLSSFKGHYKVQHGGNIDGFSASTCFFPSDSVGMIILCNQDGSAIPGLVRRVLSDRILGEERTGWNEKFKKLRALRKEEQKEAEAMKVESISDNPKTNHTTDDFCGNYSHPGYGTFEIKLRNDSLICQFPLMQFWLRNVHYDIYELFLIDEHGLDTTESLDMHFNFATSNSGDIKSVSFLTEVSLESTIFKRTAAAVDLSPEALEFYIGDYELSNGAVKVLVQDNKLYVQIEGQPEFELQAVGKDEFAIVVLDGFKVEFKAEKDGKFQELYFVQPNGTFKAERK